MTPIFIAKSALKASVNFDIDGLIPLI